MTQEAQNPEPIASRRPSATSTHNDVLTFVLSEGIERGRTFTIKRWLKNARYEVIDILADGGMGVLFRARDHRVGGNIVLIKTVKYDSNCFGYDRQAALYHIYGMRQRFKREKTILIEMALRGINHVPSLNDFFYDENPSLFVPMPFGTFAPQERLSITGGNVDVQVALEPFIVMERIYGKSVSDLMPHWSPIRLLRAARDLCKILTRIHKVRVREDGSSLQFIYMDLKPDNLLLDAQGGLRLVDFGAAVPVVNQKRRGTGAFTPGFAAPELRRIAHPSAIIDSRVDLYSLGAILFQGLTEDQINPMDLATPMEDEFPILNPAMIKRDLHPLIRDLVIRSTARDPRERFASSTVMSEAIERAIRET